MRGPVFARDVAIIPLSDQGLDHWTYLHGSLFPWACIQGLLSPVDESYINQHFVLLSVAPREDHGGVARRWFRVTDIQVYRFSVAEFWGSYWKETFKSFKQERDERQKMNVWSQGVLLIVQTPSLAPKPIKLELLPKDTWGSHYEPDWKMIVTDDIEAGLPTSSFLSPKPALPSMPSERHLGRH